MLKHILKIFYNNNKRNKSAFFLSLIGLSTGLASAILVYLWISSEISYDNCYPESDRIFQVMLNKHTPEGVNTTESIPYPVPGKLKETIPEVELSGMFLGFDQGDEIKISFQDKVLFSRAGFSSEDYFKIFGYDVYEHDAEVVLPAKTSVAISETVASRLFNTTSNVVGKTIQLDDTVTLHVSAVFRDFPSNSSQKFDIIMSFDFLDYYVQLERNWSNIVYNGFVRLRDGVEEDIVNGKITNLVKQFDAQSNFTLFIRPQSTRYLYNKFENGVQSGGKIEYVRLFALIAVFTLVIASINFTNLSTATASNRLKEIGIKKALGCDRGMLIGQHIGESLITTLLSVIIALLLVLLVLPAFNVLVSKNLTLEFNPGFLLMLAITTLFTGLAAGAYPAFYLTGLQPVKALKKQLGWSGLNFSLRKGLVGFQFVISITFIFLAFVVYKQIDFVQSKELGFDKRNVIVVPIKGNIQKNRESFIQQIRALPGVETASSLNQPIYHNNHLTTRLSWPGKSDEDVVEFINFFVDYYLIETYRIAMKEGRSFSKDFGLDGEAVIFNQAAIDAMGLKNPIGQEVDVWGRKRKIIGVTENFHNRSLFEEVKPMYMWLRPESTWNIVVKVKQGQERDVIATMEELSKSLNPGYPFEYQFTDQKYAELYKAESQMEVLARIFMVLATIISGLGLYSLAAFSIERRFKEIGIRRTFGLSKIGVVFLLTKDFIMVVFIAILISTPISIMIANDWLNSFAFHFGLKWWYFVITGLVALLIAVLTTITQSIKGANINVIKSLKYD